ncbi:N-acetyltransferase [Paenibacillus sp. KQZ6P-2]|uniref:N-acetyltransferase n=2 Tax=Paenibacillus mangrovi TaxID=2931978 RepID=A0A9X2B125_9BACL|nr:N-acetyltransferase [Paenibacillus mangrovi]MCJ8010861.1 N-acetyltransferase [Paenibacillus mangrovi]
MKMNIRTETAADYEQVAKVLFHAFGDREDESELVKKIRKSATFVPELSLVAERDHEILGHILLSKAEVVDEGSSHEVIALAPLAVSPDHQKQGIGRRLIQEGLERCQKLGLDLVLLIGHPEYYPKFGFKPARPYGLELKQFDVPDDVFMVCELQDGALNRIKGELRYPRVFLE